MTTPPPKVSVIIPTYQRSALLREVVEGILAQTLRDIEVLVMDDGSTDGTAAAMEAIADPRLRYHRKERLGVPEIVNEGFKEAMGDYLIICHDHDAYEADMLEQFSAVLDAHPSVSYVFSALVLCAEDGKIEIQRDVHDLPTVTAGMDFLRQQLLPRLDSCVGVWTMVRRSTLGTTYLLERVGGCADVELWHRLCLRGDVGYVKKPLVRVRGRDPASVFFLAEAELLHRLLDAKQPYLAYAQDTKMRRKALGNWRRTTDKTVLSNIYKCLKVNDLISVPHIARLAAAHGGRTSRVMLSILVRLPRSLSLAFLGFLRLFRAMSTSKIATWRFLPEAPGPSAAYITKRT